MNETKRTFRPQRVRARKRHYYPHEGGNADGRYNSHQYRKARQQQLDELPNCQIRTHCDGAKATCVDHIVEIKGPHDPRLCDRSNMRSCCYSCNTAKAHSRKRRGRSGGGTA